MTDTDLRNKIARLLDIRGLMGSRQIEEVTPFLLSLIHERERKAKLDFIKDFLETFVDCQEFDKKGWFDFENDVQVYPVPRLINHFKEYEKMLKKEMGYDQASK